jgi:hypothetical protein
VSEALSELCFGCADMVADVVFMNKQLGGQRLDVLSTSFSGGCCLAPLQ